jgi:uracil-DNA glycosylase family 4
LADARRRYLAIQRELGGNEVILSAPLGDLMAKSREVDLPASRPADWRKGAPPIPGNPGITVLAPPRGLMDSPPAWETLDQVAATIASCVDCFLCQGRRTTVPGEGNPRAPLMFVGEGPGQVEDETGRPFVGRAGELLTKMLEAIGLRRDEVFIANAVKCRPPQNRKPLPDELAACWRYLERQIELVRPKALVALGATAAETLLQVRRSLAELRGRVHSYRGIPLVVTYHPAALLRNPNWKKPAWDDIRIARQLLDR